MTTPAPAPGTHCIPKNPSDNWDGTVYVVERITSGGTIRFTNGWMISVTAFNQCYEVVEPRVHVRSQFELSTDEGIVRYATIWTDTYATRSEAKQAIADETAHQIEQAYGDGYIGHLRSVEHTPNQTIVVVDHADGSTTRIIWSIAPNA